MPTALGFTVHIHVNGQPLPETHIEQTSDGRKITCRIPCQPGKKFDIRVSNPTNNNSYALLYELDDIAHDERILKPGPVNDTSRGWNRSKLSYCPYKWAETPQRFLKHNPDKGSLNVGKFFVMIFPMKPKYFLEEDKFFGKPFSTRYLPQSGERDLTHYVALGDQVDNVVHPTRADDEMGVISGFYCAKAGCPHLAFHFEYFHNIPSSKFLISCNDLDVLKAPAGNPSVPGTGGSRFDN
ncbi:hypothetical protein M422DRAFT_54976 [Sphaerobolus stellatus SS14]|uniref:Uncharacterized protein n=1 Tax=Sphaerobolus stellatus (strain SS14) TaxID=990650 RepID=A0A0C9TEB0_SPHS4|nr:hypothetical protein M422DRAFT_54976 [Sphaerobolus stellatus SS14]